MATLYKMEMYILDINDHYGDCEHLIDRLESRSEAYLSPFNIESVDIEWDDDIDINDTEATVETYRKYFE